MIASSPAYLVTGILGLAVVTVLTRASFFMLPPRVTMPRTVERALRYAPACALAAIIAPAVLAADGKVELSADNHQLLAVLVGTLVFLRIRNIVVLMSVVMAVYTALRLFA